MRCLFCKQNSDASRSVEHIVPQSLGNSRHVLPRGIVCDRCNNYFARKVEQPFLASGAIVHLRATQALRNKAGRRIAVPCVLTPGYAARLYPPHSEDDMGILDIEDVAAIQHLVNHPGEQLLMPVSMAPPDDHVVSRLLAKMALEAMAARGIDAGLDYEELVDHSGLDEIRRHARIGNPGVRWPYSVRRIYDADKAWGDNAARTQVLHEFDFLITDSQEWYFVVAIFGLELVVNLGGPVIDGYGRWLFDHNQVSPLYWGKNASAP